ncbi:MAG: class I SAM-dependent methyltransferase [Candidatus Binatia bacterium]
MSALTQFLARRHGGMACCYEHFTAALEHAGLAAIRAELAGALRGRIVEIGCGTGLNFRHYARGARVAAVEPLADFYRFAAGRADGGPAEIAVIAADAQALPFADATFDGALATLVWCSVPDAVRGLAELRRVLKPGAPLCCFEHVRSEHPALGLAQDLLNPLWRHFMDGCNLNRASLTAIRAAGFRIADVRAHALRGAGVPPLPMREIRARA